MSPGYLVRGYRSSESYFSHTFTETINFIHTSLPCNLFSNSEDSCLEYISVQQQTDTAHLFFQPNTKLTKVVVKFRCCSPVTLGKNLSLINEDAGRSYWNKKQNQTYWVREDYFESQLKIQDMIFIITVKTNTKEPYHRKKHTSSSLPTLKYRIFTKKAASQNQPCRQLGNSLRTTKSNKATIIVSAALQLLHPNLYRKALSEKYNFCYVGE